MAKTSEILNVLEQEHQQVQARLQKLQQELDLQLTNLRQGLRASVSSADSGIKRDMEGFCSQLRSNIDQLNPAMEEIFAQRMESYRKAMEQAFAKRIESIQQQYQKGQKSFLAEARAAFRRGLMILGPLAALVTLTTGMLGWMLGQKLTLQELPYQNRDGFTYMQVALDQKKKPITFTDKETGKLWVAVQTQADSPMYPDKKSK